MKFGYTESILLILFNCLAKLDQSVTATGQGQSQLEFFQELLEFLSKWRPDSDIALISLEGEDNAKIEKLAKHNPRLSIQLISMKCGELNISFIANRESFKGSIYIFDAKDTNETLACLDIVNQVEKQRSASLMKFRAPNYIFFYPLMPEPDSDNDASQSFKSIFANVTTNFLLNSNVFFAITSQNKLSIFEFYSLNTGSENQSNILVVNPVRLSVSNIGRIWQNRMNFQGIRLRATAPKDNMTQGEIVWGKDANSGKLSFQSGFGTSILKSFQISLNFEILALPTDGWATQFPNGSWASGMANEILEGRADIGIAKTSILPNRAKALGYLIPVHTLIVTAFFRQPPISSVRNIFTHPFETSVWIIIICTWIIIICMVGWLAWVKSKIHNDLDPHDKLMVEASGVWAIGAISQHGFYITPHSRTFRIIFFVAISFGFLTFVAYSATLVSIFTSIPIPIRNVEDLIQSTLTILVDKDSAGAKLVGLHNPDLTYSPAAISLVKKISKGAKTGISSGNHSAILFNASVAGGLIFTKNVAFLTFKDNFYTTIGNFYKKSNPYLCQNIYSFPVANIPFRSGIFVAKNSPYKEGFNNRLICLYGSGVMKRYVRHYEGKYTPKCNPELEPKHTPSLGTSDTFLAYILLVIGYCSSGAALIVELIVFRKEIRFNQKIHE